MFLILSRNTFALWTLVLCLEIHSHVLCDLRARSISDILANRDGSEQSLHSHPRYSTVEQHFFEQRLDHFHPCNTENKVTSCPPTFQQRFFYSDRLVARHDPIMGPTFAFLCIGGEGPDLDESVLVDSIHCTGDMIELAEILHQNYGFNIHLFALEHRYYGLSYPDFGTSSPVSKENLVYLSSRQALSDIASFITHMNHNPRFFIDPSTSWTSSSRRGAYQPSISISSIPWVAFGGSYPGMLSAWLRLKFPHLVLASVSNSAPIQVTLDFRQYKEKVGWDLQNIHIGGSDECLNRIQRGHEDIYELLKQNQTLVADMFSLCHGAASLMDHANILAFLGDGVVDIPAQNNDLSCDGELCNIQKICDFVQSFTGDVGHPASMYAQALASLSQAQLKLSSQMCKNIDWNDMLAFLSSPDAQMDGIRSWLWQTCNEVGFFQTCPSDSTCPFGRGFHNIQQDLDICRIVFGISSDQVQKNVDETIAFYGGWDLHATNVLSVNGNVDPWSTMSMRSDCADHSKCPSNTSILWVNRTSHHFWTHKSQSTDTEELVHIRGLIHDWVTDLLLRSVGLESTLVNISYK